MLDGQRAPHAPPPPLVASLDMLCRTHDMYSQHRLAVAVVARAAGLHEVANMVDDDACLDPSLRDTALEYALKRVYAQLADERCQAWAQHAVECHIRVADLGDEAGIGPVMMHDDIVRAGGGNEALAQAVQDYVAVRELCLDAPRWHGSTTEPPRWHGSTTERPRECRTTRQVLAKNNDTVGKLCERYPDTSARDMLRLNPELARDGFGQRNKRLRDGTPVFVYAD